jgi:hypothetical protein
MASNDMFDFGFTAVNEDELEAVQKLSASAEEATSLEQRVEMLYASIQPLLNQLKANPSKEYIYWPNRLDKIETFEKHLYEIYNGEQ